MESQRWIFIRSPVKSIQFPSKEKRKIPQACYIILLLPVQYTLIRQQMSHAHKCTSLHPIHTRDTQILISAHNQLYKAQMYSSVNENKVKINVRRDLSCCFDCSYHAFKYCIILNFSPLNRKTMYFEKTALEPFNIITEFS